MPVELEREGEDDDADDQRQRDHRVDPADDAERIADLLAPALLRSHGAVPGQPEADGDGGDADKAADHRREPQHVGQKERPVAA